MGLFSLGGIRKEPGGHGDTGGAQGSTSKGGHSCSRSQQGPTLPGLKGWGTGQEKGVTLPPAKRQLLPCFWDATSLQIHSRKFPTTPGCRVQTAHPAGDAGHGAGTYLSIASREYPAPLQMYFKHIKNPCCCISLSSPQHREVSGQGAGCALGRL